VKTKAPNAAPDARDPVLLYDGECGLCNFSVRFLLRLDRRARLRFSPLQSLAAQAYLRSRSLPTHDFDSMIFVPDWGRRSEIDPLFKTDAAIAAVRALGGMWKGVTVLRWVPRNWRDALYTQVARMRHRLFRPYTPRPLPNPEWQKRFF
jgi:predicted DCC family thiol-disulfide oxidoreductase YuxK